MTIAFAVACIVIFLLALLCAAFGLWEIIQRAKRPTLREAPPVPHKLEPPEIYGGDTQRGDGHGGSYDLTGEFCAIAREAQRSQADGRTSDELMAAEREFARRQAAARQAASEERKRLVGREDWRPGKPDADSR